jgi:hypothetical protein
VPDFFEVLEKGQRIPVTIRDAQLVSADAGLVGPLTYHDDGVDGDAVAGDLRYSNRLTPSKYPPLAKKAQQVRIEAIIEAGAQDFEADGEGGVHFYTEPGDVDAVSKALSARGFTVAAMRIGWRSKNPVKLDAGARAEVEQFLHELDEDDDVQHIYVGLDASASA